MKKTFAAIMLIVALAGAASGQAYWKGNGGKGQSVAVLVPEGRGLSADEAYLPTLVQGVFVGDFSKYSAMSILDRQNLEKVLRETESGIYESQSDFIELGKITKTSLLLSGSVTKTQTAYTFSIAVTDTKSGQTKAAYNGSCTIAEFDNFSGIKKASLELLTGMGVQLTDAAKAELSGAAAARNVKAQTALAQGITAQKRGTAVESLMYYNMAAAFDPSLLEAQKRVSVTAAGISSGNIGEDARNDIKWRKDWIARLTEFERFLDNYLKTNPPQYEFIYSTALNYGKVDYQKETMPITLFARLVFADFGYFEALGKTIETVRQGLEATGRAETWELDWWPSRSFLGNMSAKPGSLFDTGYIENAFEIVIDILNDNGKVIGSAKRTVMGVYCYGKMNYDSEFRYGANSVVVFESRGIEGIAFVAGEWPSHGKWAANNRFTTTTSVYAYTVNVNDITDTLTVRITTVNGADPASAKNLTITEYKGEVQTGWEEIVFDGGGKISPNFRKNSDITYLPASPVWGKTITGIADYVVAPGPWYRVDSGSWKSLSLQALGTFYARNGRKAGKYEWNGKKWKYR